MKNPGELLLSIVLPCYNEADNLLPLLRRYAEVWEDLPAELILVDNGSTDHTAEVLRHELADPALGFARTVVVPKNKGYGHGVFTGLQAARGRFVAFSHADMQCNPADVFSAYHHLAAQPDAEKAIVKGRRATRGLGATVLTNGMSIVATTILGTRLTDINAQPKVFPSALLRQMKVPPTGFEFDVYVLYAARLAGFRFLTVPVVFGERHSGQSKWAFSLRSRLRTIFRTVLYILRLRMGKET